MRLASAAHPCWFAFGLLLVLPLAPAAADTVRTWTDASGKFKIEAEFIEVSDGRARLKTADGKIVGLPLAKLSKQDRQYLRDLMRERKLEAEMAASGGNFGDGRASGPIPPALRAAGGGRGIPAARTRNVPPPIAPGRVAATPLKEPAKAGAVSPADLTGMLAVPSRSTNPTRLGAAPAAPAPPDKWNPSGVMLAPGYDDSLKSLHATPGAPWVVCLGYAAGFRSPWSRIELVDVAAGKHLGNFAGPPFMVWARISPSGRRLLTNSTIDGSENLFVLDVWEIDGKKLKHIVSWQPYSEYSWPNLEPQMAEWVDDEHVMTNNREGKVRCWQLDGAKALYQVELMWDSPRLSADGTRLLSRPINGGGVQALGAVTGEWLGVMSTGKTSSGWGTGGFAVSPAGERLAVAGSATLTLQDLGADAPGVVVGLPETGRRGDLRWVDANHVLLGDTLVNVDLKAPVWKYRIAGKTVVTGNVLWTYAKQGAAAALLPVAIPHAEALAAEATLDPAALWSVAPGVEVAVDVQLGDAALANAVRQQLETSATAAGFRVVATAPLRLVARTEAGESNTRTYEVRQGLDRHEETVTVTSQNHVVALQLDGRELWRHVSTTSNDPGMFIHARGDQSLQAAVDERLKTNVDAFAATLPNYVVSPDVQQRLGESTLSQGAWVTQP